MQDLAEMFTRYRKYIMFLLAIYVIGWGFTAYQSIFLGLILGTVISLYNLFTLARKNKQFNEAIEEGRKMRSLGTLSRMAAAGLAVLIVMEYPDKFHLVSTILGLMTSYIVIMIDFFFQNIRK
ncbi:ATP synthase subunit I [Fredinandcohnia quinoae]|uniref:ATP synthase subunit I n=1 Tax=Fredinandcohnia quinoae TaxID=2918902 RepID=A0AAW5E6A3_9BACI|nr:ATP synthase subunit I [Fredinandcohnia sp. SECRCQ15]MCH1625135.1 ATP synthase subunit I [Fredinandcohnia sp. SECRCQ15]